MANRYVRFARTGALVGIVPALGFVALAFGADTGVVEIRGQDVRAVTAAAAYGFGPPLGGVLVAALWQPGRTLLGSLMLGWIAVAPTTLAFAQSVVSLGPTVQVVVGIASCLLSGTIFATLFLHPADALLDDGPSP